MKQMKLSMLLSVLCLMSVSASADVVFTDDFESGLGNWNLINNGTSSITIAGDADKIVDVRGGNSWCAAVTKDTFTTPGAYRLDLDAVVDIRNTNTGAVRFGLPGGLTVGFQGWNNGFLAWYKDVPLEGGGWTSADVFYQWRSYAIEIDGRTAKLFKDEVLQKEWTLDSDPDFVTYSTVSLVGVSDAGYDAFGMFNNVSLRYVPEPATMSLLAAGGLLILRRRRA